MTNDFVTDLEGMIPNPIMPSDTPPVSQVCDEVSLRVTFLYNNHDTHRAVVRFDMDSPYFLDEHDKANCSWCMAMPYYEMALLVFTLLQSPFMKVTVRREELLAR